MILETGQNGVSLREYIWLDDMPISVIDQANTASPVLCYVRGEPHFHHRSQARRLSKDFEATIESALAWLQLAPAFLLMRGLARPKMVMV